MSNEPTPTTCPECGMNPMGRACYHICPNSDHYYSPEQERADEANYDPQEYYREGGFEDPDLYPDSEPEVCYLGHEDCWDNHTSERLADEADWEADRQRELGSMFEVVGEIVVTVPLDDDIPF